MFFIDILLTLNTAYFKNGVICNSRAKIFKHYKKIKNMKYFLFIFLFLERMFIDMLVIFPYVLNYIVRRIFHLNIPFIELALMLRISHVIYKIHHI